METTSKTMDCLDRDRVLRKIERVFSGFQEVLKAGSRPTLFLPEPDVGDAEILELRSCNPHRFLYVTRVLLRIYESVKTNTYLTRRDLFEESKDIFVNQATLDGAINFVTHLLQESRLCLHIQRDVYGSALAASQESIIDLASDESGFNSPRAASQQSKMDDIVLPYSQDSAFESLPYSQSQLDTKPSIAELLKAEITGFAEPEVGTATPRLEREMELEAILPEQETVSALEQALREVEPAVTPPVQDVGPETTAAPASSAKRGRGRPRKQGSSASQATTTQQKPRSRCNKIFHVDTKKLIDRGLLTPLVDNLEYTDPEDGYHAASLRRRGQLQTDGADVRKHKNLGSWLRTVLKMKPRQRAGLDNESKRVLCRERSMLSCMRQADDDGHGLTLRLRRQSGSWKVVSGSRGGRGRRD